jgi:hypothetical protein
MEFATEMVVSALRNHLRISEIPINYHPRQGESKLNSFPDAWRHIRFMLLYCPAWLYFIPGTVGFMAGLLILMLLLKGPFLFMGHSWDIHVMIFGAVICILSYQILSLGIFAHTFAVSQGLINKDGFMLFLERNFKLEKGIFFGALLFLSGLVLNLSIFLEWFVRHFGQLYRIRESILAMTLLVIGIQTIFSSFFVSLLFLKKEN